MLSHFSHVWLFATPGTVARQARLSMGFSKQEYWSRLPCLPPRDLPNPGIEPMSPVAPALQAVSLPLVGPSCLFIPYNSLHFLIPNSQSIPPHSLISIMITSSSLTRDSSWAVCFGSMESYHWTTRGVPRFILHCNNARVSGLGSLCIFWTGEAGGERWRLRERKRKSWELINVLLLWWCTDSERICSLEIFKSVPVYLKNIFSWSLSLTWHYHAFLESWHFDFL